MVYHPVTFDIDDFLSRIRGNKPPFVCPAETCHKVCKTYSYIQKHMVIHRPPAPIDIPAPVVNGISSLSEFSDVCTGERDADNHLKNLEGAFTCGSGQEEVVTPMQFTDSRTSVVFETLPSTNGQTLRCNIFVPLTIRLMVNCPEIVESVVSDCGDTVPKSLVNRSTHEDEDSKVEDQSRTKPNSKSRGRYRNNKGKTSNKTTCLLSESMEKSSVDNNESRPASELPKAVYTVDPEFSLRKPANIKEGSGYIRFIEKSFDELDEVVEYDLDEEDLFWLKRINTMRKSQSLASVSESTLEWVMDRFEKNARFRFSAGLGLDSSDGYPDIASSNSAIDEDAVCAVCQDGTCENTNVILFCDVCNLAVHQECYGVPYVPEGPWLCRKCLHSPSEPVSCVLCPNRGGAFKKTADDSWAHVICGLWVPEVMFANLTFLEPLEGIDRIAPARWRLQCFICKQRNAGACIQCHKTSCYRAFHVTCAQHAGLYMKIEHTNEPGDLCIRKSAFCDLHCPPNHFSNSNKGMYAHSDSESPQSPEQAARIHLRKARKVLAERRNSKPSVCLPIVSKVKMKVILSKLVGVAGDKMDFLKKAYAFWKLKREFRRGVPLLKRLQACSIHKNAANFAAAATTGDAESQKMRIQLKFWQQLRQDLEKARLLSELTRKRERIKRDLFNAFIVQTELTIQPFSIFQHRLLDQLRLLDKNEFFTEPVLPSLAPDYTSIIKHPMDFSTMQEKVKNHEYPQMDNFVTDFKLILSNCFQYNRASSIYYAAAVKLRDEGNRVLSRGVSMAKQLNLHSHSDFLIENTNIVGNIMNCNGKHMEYVENVENSDKSLENHEVAEDDSLVIKSEAPLSTPVSSPSMCKEPLKELVNCDRSNSMVIVTRSRLRSSTASSSTTICKDLCVVGSNDGIEVIGAIEHSRKRRHSSLTTSESWHLSSPNSPSGDDRRVTGKQPRLQATNLKVDSELDQSKVSSLFDRQDLLTSGTGNRLSNQCKWNSTNKSPSEDSASYMLARMADSQQQQQDEFFEIGNIKPNNTQHGPAFTRYRSVRVSRGDEDEDEETDDSEDDDDSDDELSNTRSLVNDLPDGSNHSRDKQIHSPKSHVLHTLTTVIGSSRMASSSRGSNKKSRSSFYKHKTKKVSKIRRNKFTTRRNNCVSQKSKTPSSAESQHMESIALISPMTTAIRVGVENTDVLIGSIATSKHASNISQSQSSDGSASAIPTNNLECTNLSLATDCSDNVSCTLDSSTATELYDTGNHSGDSVILQSVSNLPSKVPPYVLGKQVECASCMLHRFNSLDVVWSKCPGSPWYPALIVDSNATEGYSHNGVPIPTPSESVLNLGKRIQSKKASGDEILLVLFFDTKRTWQWLSPKKLQLLGVNKELDAERLREGRRSKMKHSVAQAYRRAVEHMCKVHGRPYPFTDGKSNESFIFSL